MKGPHMSFFGTALAVGLAVSLQSAGAGAQTAACGTPPRLIQAGSSDTTPAIYSADLELRASLSARTLEVIHGDTTLGRYSIAVGSPQYPTPTGTFRITKIIWNPSWHPPESQWAKNKKPQPPGSPKNPMRIVKILFGEPDFYIHGTDDEESLGAAASHGCIRMDPDEIGAVARLIMEHGGQPRDENWFWRIVHFRSEEKTVILDNPVRLVITP